MLKEKLLFQTWQEITKLAIVSSVAGKIINKVIIHEQFNPTIFIHLVKWNDKYYLLNNHDEYHSLSSRPTTIVPVKYIYPTTTDQFQQLCDLFNVKFQPTIQPEPQTSLLSYVMSWLCVAAPAQAPVATQLVNMITAEDILAIIEELYPNNVRDSANPVKPNISKVQLLKNLKSLDLTKCNKTREDIKSAIKNANDSITYDANLISQRTEAIISKHGFKLGLNETGPTFWANLLQVPEIAAATPTPHEYKKKPLDKKFRIEIWDHYIGKDKRIGACQICNKDIDIMNFECAHIEAESRGGQNILSNLIPTCQDCNRSMGTENAWEYKKRYQAFIKI